MTEDIKDHIARDDESKQAGRNVERAAIVAWLLNSDIPYLGDDECIALVDAIERGEHRK